MKFSEKLRRIRTTAEERQEDLGAAIGITQRTIIMYESGERSPRDKNIYEKLAEHYNTPV